MSNLEINFDVQNQSIYYIEKNKVVSDSSQYLYAQFKFSDDWFNPKYALFYANDQSEPMQIQLDENDGCYVPPDIIKPPFFYVSVYCSDGAKQITTEKQKVKVQASGFTGDLKHIIVQTPTGESRVMLIRQADGVFEYTSDGENWHSIDAKIDADKFVLKEPGNANDIIFDDGETFQQKYNAGELKGNDGEKGERGEKGDLGEKGERGEKGEPGDNGADAVLLTKEGADFTPEELPEGAWGGVY